MLDRDEPEDLVRKEAVTKGQTPQDPLRRPPEQAASWRQKAAAAAGSRAEGEVGGSGRVAPEFRFREMKT